MGHTDTEWGKLGLNRAHPDCVGHISLLDYPDHDNTLHQALVLRPSSVPEKVGVFIA